MSTRPSLPERLFYGAGNLPGTIVTTGAGFLMFFFTDVAALSAATVGAFILAVKVWDACWDLMVGRWVDRHRGRWGQCRPFLFAGAALFPLAMAAVFWLPPLDPSGRLVWAVLAYAALQMVFSIIMIPYQSLPVLQSDHEADRAQLAGSQALWTFVGVMGVNGGTMALVAALGGPDKARGFWLTMTGWGLLGGAALLLATGLARERIAPAVQAPRPLGPDLRTLLAHRSWQSLGAVKLLFTVGLSMQLGTAIYYAGTVMQAPALVGPLMLANALGLVAGVPLSLWLLRRMCLKRLSTATFAGAALLSLGFLVVPPSVLPAVMGLNAAIGLMLGMSLPAFGPAIPNMVDHVELDSGQRLMGLSVATLNFAEKVGAGIASALIGALLAGVGYEIGRAHV